MKTNVIQEKSFSFAIRIVNLCKGIMSSQKEYILTKQLLRSGTSIGANVEEAIGGVSKADFLHKLSISYKETRETLYWIKLLNATNYIEQTETNLLLSEAEELKRILGKIIVTGKSNLKKA